MGAACSTPSPSVQRTVLSEPVIKLEIAGDIVLVRFKAGDVITVDFVDKNCFQTYDRFNVDAVLHVLQWWMNARMTPPGETMKVAGLKLFANFVTTSSTTAYTEAWQARSALTTLVTIAAAMRRLERSIALPSETVSDVVQYFPTLM